MKIALFHNLPAGGAKRALYEHARHLHSRGYVLDAYVPATAVEDYLPLAPLCQQVFRYPVPDAAPPGRRERLRELLLRRARGSWPQAVAADAARFRHEHRKLDALLAVYEKMAEDINARHYDLAYVHQCLQQQSPSLLPALDAPSVYFCQDTMRYVYEWALPEQPEYDALPENDDPDRRRRLGGVYTRAALDFFARKERLFVANTRAATRVLVNSWYSREAVLRTTGVSARVCYLGVDSRFFCPDPAVPRENLVLSVGGLFPNKRHDFVIEALATIPAPRRPRLEIIGYEMAYGDESLGPYARSLLCLAEERDVSLAIRKDVSDEALRAGYRRAKAVAFAPYLEPFGFIPLEAAACGTPTVGVSEGGLRETIRDGETGLLTDLDAAAFGAALDRLLRDPALAARLGECARARARDRWTWERSADTLEAHFEQVLREREIRRESARDHAATSR